MGGKTSVTHSVGTEWVLKTKRGCWIMGDNAESEMGYYNSTHRVDFEALARLSNSKWLRYVNA